MTHIPPLEPPKDWGMVDFLAATHHFMVVLITIIGLVTGGIVGGPIGSMVDNHEAGMLWGAIIFGFWWFFRRRHSLRDLLVIAGNCKKLPRYGTITLGNEF